MRESTEVASVGGGIVGTCTALFLARAGVENVTVIERDLSFERSSTTRSAAAIRQQFHLAVNVAMSHFGYDFFTNLSSFLAEVSETDIAFENRSYLVLATADALDRLRTAHENQVRQGAQTELLDLAELSRRFPWLKSDDLGGATFGTAGEGWFDPRRALDVLRAGAEALGVAYVEDDVVGIDVSAGRVQGVRLASGGALRSPVVVDAAGASAAEIARMVSLSIPVEGRKRTVHLFRPKRPVDGVPNVVDPTVAGRGMYLRPYEDAFMVVTAPTPERDPDSRDLKPDTYLFDEILRDALARRVHGFEDVEVVGGWAGHYELNTYDQNALIGGHAAVDGFYLACGFSGHGVMHAPAAGRGIAELVTEGRYTTIDLSPFSVERIAKGERLDDIQPSEKRDQKAGI